MAFKKYGYYLKGNKIAVIEQSDATSGGNLAVAHCAGVTGNYTTKDTCEAAGGQWIPGSSGSTSSYSEYMSPTESVTDGLEIQYAYSPTFNLQSTGTEGIDFHKFLGWGSDGTNLLLFTYGDGEVRALDGLFAADDYIYITGSGRWSGLHQVKSEGSSSGILTLKTKCNLKPSKISVTVDFTTDETLDGTNTDNDLDIEVFKDLISSYDSRSTPYIFIDGAYVEWDVASGVWESITTLWNTSESVNSGAFSVTYGSTSGQITLGNKITIDADGDYTSAAAAISAESGDSLTIYNMFYEQISVYEGVEVLSGASAETFELDISRYQANAVVYYLKAKMAEDMMDMEAREFFMREFKRQLEKGVSALKRGPYMVQGFSVMR